LQEPGEAASGFPGNKSSAHPDKQSAIRANPLIDMVFRLSARDDSATRRITPFPS